jgi:energy-coupling factor transporter ATP-binding protein EcfA2
VQEDTIDARYVQLQRYLWRGWALVPLHDVSSGTCSCSAGADCRSAGKHPVLHEWQRPEHLVRGEDGLRAALERWPSCNWGLATGLISGAWALDYDPKSVDPAQGAEVAAVLANCWASATWVQKTGSGGLHFLFALPEDFVPNNGSGRLPRGFDVRGARRGESGGGQIVLAPSVSGVGAYELLADRPVTAAPAGVLEAVRPAAPRVHSQPLPLATRDQSAVTRYVVAALAGELDALRGCWTQRNQRAWRAAARCIEMINTGLVSGESVYAAWWAAGLAHPDRSVVVPEVELLRVWASAERHVGDRPADLSGVGGPSGWGGDAILPTGAPGVPLSSAGGSGAGTVGGTGYPQSVDGAVDSPVGLTLPEAFWAARPVLKHIREAAWARTVSGDVVLYSVLARLAALWTPSVRLDTGVKSPASANLFVAITGPSGAGKSSGVSVARGLLPEPAWLREGDAFTDDAPLGSGEGVAEAYMGTVWKPTGKLGGDGLPEQDKDGTVKLVKVRGQVRGNALLHADEGEVLNKMLQRTGATIGETLRRAWVGATLGQANGTAETTRIVPEGSYSLGLLIGFQRETAQPLLADAAAGTPQRFLWAWATDPSIPQEETSHPGVLTGVWPPTWTPGMAVQLDPTPRPDIRPVVFAQGIRAELRALHLGLSTGRESLPEMDAHMPLTLVKVSALLAALDGRREVEDEDWTLAKMLWLTSCRVRDHLISHARAARGKELEAQARLHAGRAYDAEHARGQAADERETKSIERVARWIAGKVRARSGRKAYQLRKDLAGRDKPIFEAGLERALELRWVEVDAEGVLGGGTSRPDDEG